MNRHEKPASVMAGFVSVSDVGDDKTTLLKGATQGNEAGRLCRAIALKSGGGFEIGVLQPAPPRGVPSQSHASCGVPTFR